MWHPHCDCWYRLGNLKYLVNTHRKLHQFHDAFPLLIHLVGNEANTDVRFYPSCCKVKNRTYFKVSFRYTEGPLHDPELVILAHDFLCRHIRICDVPLPTVPSDIFFHFLLVDGYAYVPGNLKKLVVPSSVETFLLDDS